MFNFKPNKVWLKIENGELVDPYKSLDKPFNSSLVKSNTLFSLFKFLIYSFANKYSFHLIADLKTQISSKIFNNYANRDYIFFKQNGAFEV